MYRLPPAAVNALAKVSEQAGPGLARTRHSDDPTDAQPTAPPQSQWADKVHFGLMYKLQSDRDAIT
jgi:hypothetical protein